MVSLINLSSKKINYDVVINSYISNVNWLRKHTNYTPGTGVKNTKLTNPYKQTKQEVIKNFNTKYDWFYNKSGEPDKIHKVALARALWYLKIKNVVFTVEHIDNGFDDLNCFIFLADNKKQLEPVVSRKWKEV